MDELAAQVGRLFVVGFEGTTAPLYLLEWLAEGRVGGVILFARNVESPSQLAALTSGLRVVAPRPILIGIDQEGGTVARLRGSFTESPSAMALSNSNDEAQAERCYGVLGTEMRALGINWDYAPVVDISYNRENPTVGVRSFGTQGSRVSRYAAAAVRGLQKQGVAACAKHFPGLGNTAIDTHVALPTIDTPLDHLLAHDLLPYRTLMAEGVASIMTTHTIYAALDEQYPATLSPHVIQRLIRQELGYDGLVTSDCMEMKAIADHYEPGAYAVLGALAGLDVILVSHTRAAQEEAYRGLLAAVEDGRVPLARIREANRRIEALLARYAIAEQPNLQAIATPEHQQIVLEAARLGLRAEQHKPLKQPIVWGEGVAVVEFASVLETEVLESGGATGLYSAMQQLSLSARYVALKSSEDDPQAWETAQRLAREADLLIVVTRNAHLLPVQQARATALAEAARDLIFIHARNPYDAEVLPTPHATIATYGDAAPQLRAALERLIQAEPTIQPLYYQQA
ncbi:MAG: beta-N-acetylhexosaminidase [Anaerolineae bacterium]|nr:beta-N-acetylhexosaminidase [Anaerolineae bacterium]MDW8173519.1 beta-N-acetylhexosaminidase [Anaerolineae bacterium]